MQQRGSTFSATSAARRVQESMGAILRAAPVSLPPLSEQVQIVYEVVRHRLAAAGNAWAASLNPPTSNGHRPRANPSLREAFSGNLVPQRPERTNQLLSCSHAFRPLAKPRPKRGSRPKGPALNPHQNKRKRPVPCTHTFHPLTNCKKAWQKIGRKPDTKKLI